MSATHARDWEDALRSVGALLDAEGVRLVSLAEIRDGLHLNILTRGGPALVTIPAARLEQIQAQAHRLRGEMEATWGDIHLLPAERPLRQGPPRYQRLLRVVGAYARSEKMRCLVLIERRALLTLVGLVPRRAVEDGAVAWLWDACEWSGAELEAADADARATRAPAEATP